MMQKTDSHLACKNRPQSSVSFKRRVSLPCTPDCLKRTSLPARVITFTVLVPSATLGGTVKHSMAVPFAIILYLHCYDAAAVSRQSASSIASASVITSWRIRLVRTRLIFIASTFSSTEPAIVRASRLS